MDELSLGEDQSGASFWPIHESSSYFVSTYHQKFLCLKQEDMTVYGDFNSDKARMLSVQLKRCVGETYCKSSVEIEDYFRGKFLLFLTNQVRFDSEGFFEDAAIKESRVMWLTINTQAA